MSCNMSRLVRLLSFRSARPKDSGVGQIYIEARGWLTRLMFLGMYCSRLEFGRLGILMDFFVSSLYSYSSRRETPLM